MHADLNESWFILLSLKLDNTLCGSGLPIKGGQSLPNSQFNAAAPEEKSEMSEINQRVESDCPVFREGSSADDLLTEGLSVGISILPNHPCLLPSNNLKLVSFLMGLPHPSIIVLGDSINSHNVKAMWNMKKGRKTPSDEEALSLALEAAAPFREAFTRSLNHLEEERPDKSGWVKLHPWLDIQGEHMRLQQDVAKKHYENGGLLKTRIDEIAVTFLKHRRPMSKNHTARLPHLVAYLLAELPFLLVGAEMNGHHYAGLLYPLAAQALSSPIAMEMFDLIHDIHTLEEFTGLRDQITELTATGKLGLPGVILFPMETTDTTSEAKSSKPKLLERQSSAVGA